MIDNSPNLIIMAGPNGAGKSTVAPVLLRDTLGVTQFVNPDVIAQGLSAFEPDRMTFAAGRIMMTRLKALAKQRASFAFETTHASRSFAPWIRKLIQTGYQFHLLFLWLPSADFAVQRVADRVGLGGHNVPEILIRRRYEAGLCNFFALYQPLATTWQMYDNSGESGIRLIAAGQQTTLTQMGDAELWENLKQEYSSGD